MGKRGKERGSKTDWGIEKEKSVYNYMILFLVERKMRKKHEQTKLNAIISVEKNE